MSPWYSVFLPNQNQVTAGVRVALHAVSIFAASQGWIGDGTVATIASLAPSISSAIWSWIAHSQGGTIAAASALASTPNSGVLRVLTTPEVAYSARFKDDNNVVAPGQQDPSRS